MPRPDSPARPQPSEGLTAPRDFVEFGDGIVTGMGTFQKYFGTYKRGCERADALLFAAGDAAAIDAACCRSPLGKLLPKAL